MAVLDGHRDYSLEELLEAYIHTYGGQILLTKSEYKDFKDFFEALKPDDGYSIMILCKLTPKGVLVVSAIGETLP